MTSRVRWISIALSLCLAGCAGVGLRTQTRYVADAGLLEATSALRPDQVRLFRKTAPDGFRLERDVLTVDAGSGHRVLAEIVLRGDEGSCAYGSPTSELVLRALRERAAAVGADAVVFADSAVGDASDESACMRIRSSQDNVFGRGWAVVLAR